MDDAMYELLKRQEKEFLRWQKEKGHELTKQEAAEYFAMQQRHSQERSDEAWRPFDLHFPMKT